MSKRWSFIEYAKQSVSRWTWRRHLADGAIERQSGEFESYGAAVRDALNNGFDPARDHWTIESRNAVVHHERGRPSLVLPANGSARPDGMRGRRPGPARGLSRKEGR